MEDSQEFQMKYQTMRKKVLALMKWDVVKPLMALSSFAGLMLPGGGSTSVILMIAFPVLIFLYFYKTNPGFFREKRKNIQDVYMEEFIEPMLREWYPDVTVEEKEQIPFEEVKKFLPSSEEYTQNTAIQFHDEKDLRIQNCSAWHQKSRKNRTYIHDFLGQVFCMNSPVSIEGEVRIVPTDRSKFMNKEVQRRYPPCERGEKKIDTEDIQNNERYDIYTNDEMGARRFLTPGRLRKFTEHFSEREISVYLKGSKLYVAVNSGYSLFRVSLNSLEFWQMNYEEECERFRDSLGDIKDICEGFEE